MINGIREYIESKKYDFKIIKIKYSKEEKKYWMNSLLLHRASIIIMAVLRNVMVFQVFWLM